MIATHETAYIQTIKFHTFYTKRTQRWFKLINNSASKPTLYYVKSMTTSLP